VQARLEFARRLRREWVRRHLGEGEDPKLVLVATETEARRVEALGNAAQVPLMLVIADASQAAPVIAGGTVVAAMRRAYVNGWTLFVGRDPSASGGWSIWHGGEAKPLDQGALHFLLEFGDGLSHEERLDLCDLYQGSDTPPLRGLLPFPQTHSGQYGPEARSQGKFSAARSRR